MNHSRLQSEFHTRLLHLCRSDPNAFTEYTSGIKQGAMHVEIQQHLSDHDEAGVKVPRGHGKTVQVSSRIAWEIGHDPNILISVVQATDDDAQAFVESVKGIIESPRYREVFPEIEKDKTRWGKESFKVKRDGVNVKDPTLAAQPIFGNAGKRMDLLVFDDISNLDNAVRQPAKREQVKQAYRNTWLPSLKIKGRCWRIWTPWHVDDVGAEWENDKSIAIFSRACDGTKSSPWPEQFTSEELKRRRLQMGSTAYDRAYALKPMSSDEQVFFANSICASMYDYSNYSDEMKRRQFFEGAKCVIATDFAYTEDSQVSNKKAEPDYSVIMVALVMPSGHVYLIDFWMGKTKFTETLEKLYQMIAVYRPSLLMLEEVGAMKGINTIIEESVRCDIFKMNRNKDKFSRAVEQQHVVERGRFHMPGIPGNDKPDERWIPVFNQLIEFPFSKNDDATDCCIDLMSQVGSAAVDQSDVRFSSDLGDPFSVATHFAIDENDGMIGRAPDIDADPDEISDFLARIHNNS